MPPELPKGTPGESGQVWTSLGTPTWGTWLLPFFGEYLHVKNQRHWRIPSIDIDDQRILQSD